nr:immunoglobulin heavy chain junction region [Macaca mulatta]MPN69970.1 immunoglobulin heavy chain junction region [Macaca mulatta]MPN71611.1 immunoglobulin heavy chain junction region [Macaca mulatta]MPN71960.1 immunoglobulin heavy chain junction region [Macaca mulatta]MPN71973.1 immunoglobulin heavy chain junction region [Macaca mulatta]
CARDLPLVAAISAFDFW